MEIVILPTPAEVGRLAARKIAQVIVRLVRRGLHVWITTHSENFCQQINNFMKIGASPDRADLQRRFGYEDQDYLEVNDVAGYQFVSEGDRSVVTELERTPQGLVMPTFNREIYDLSRQTLELQRHATKGEP